MAIVTLNFNHNINVSVQVGDIAYYVPTVPVPTPPVTSGFANPLGTSTSIPNTVAGASHASTTLPHMTEDRENVLIIGVIIAITLTSITCDMDDTLAAQFGPPTISDFIMFSKDNKANLSSLLGYYSLLKLRNNSIEKSEIFSVGTDWVESSK
tara:strand:- start:28 stop:486 length:459 start_codon:yes stop_codon:yes gene_type:complete